MYLKQMLCNRNIKHIELTKVLGTDKSTISKIMNYRILPTPKDAQKLCDFLKCKIIDIYEPNEINLKNVAYDENKTQVDKRYYRLSVRLKLGGCNLLKQPKKLKELGYESIADWVRKKILETENEYKLYKKQTRLNAYNLNHGVKQ